MKRSHGVYLDDALVKLVLTLRLKLSVKENRTYSFSDAVSEGLYLWVADANKRARRRRR